MPNYSSYTPDVIPAIKNWMKDGATLAMVCRNLQISRQTFYNWIKKHKELEEAYKIGKEWGEGYLDEAGLHNLDNPTFNAVLYQMIRRNRCGWTEHRKVMLQAYENAETYEQRMQALNKAVATGQLTPDEYKNMMSSEAQRARVDETAQLRAEVAQLKEMVKDG